MIIGNAEVKQMLTLATDTDLVKKTANIVAPHLEVVRNDWIDEMRTEHEYHLLEMKDWADLSIQHEFHLFVEDKSMSDWLGYLLRRMGSLWRLSLP